MVAEYGTKCSCKIVAMDRPPTARRQPTPRPRTSNFDRQNFEPQVDALSRIQTPQIPPQNVEENNVLRPLSRRGIKKLQKESASSDRNRPLSRSSSIQSNRDTGTWRPPTGFGNRLQGTASRLVSATHQQHPSLSLGVVPPRLDTQVSNTDRLVTQQGLSRARSSIGSRQGTGVRMIQDKRYYEGMLQVKMRELSEEIAKLNKEIEDANKERSTFLVYDKKVKRLATQLTELQGKLADYNLCLDKIHTRTDVKHIEDECSTLQALNEKQQAKLENVFSERIQLEGEVRDLANAIDNEKPTTERLVEGMPSDAREKYNSLYNSNAALEEIIDKLQREIDNVEKEKRIVLDQISNSQEKQETAELQLQIMDLEEIRDRLLTDSSNTKRDEYAKRVIDDKKEIELMEHAIKKLTDNIEHTRKELENINKFIEESKSDRYQKYVELKKREETIVNFLSTFEQTKQEELEKMVELKSDIIKSLSKLTTYLLTTPNSQIEHELKNKEFSKIDANAKSGDLKFQYQQRQIYYQKLQVMEENLKKELEKLKERIQQMRTEVVTFSDLETLKDENQNRRNELLSKKTKLLEEKDKVFQDLKDAEKEHADAEKKLQNNDMHIQIQALEGKLSQVQQNNKALKEFIEEKKKELNFESLKQEALVAVKEYNALLIAKCGRS